MLFRSRHARAVARFLAGAGAPEADLDDLVQETFIRVFRALPGFRFESSFRTWLITIATRQALNQSLNGRAEVITRAEFQSREMSYWSRETPVGYITDLGFIMGLMIGMVFIYYAQYQIIRFYLPEYAILKSLGYDWWFFLCMIGQIGAAIITPAFLVAFALARLVYGVAETALHLGMVMGLREMVVSLVACLVMTAVSSLFAIRRLWKVDPIMLFE